MKTRGWGGMELYHHLIPHPPVGRNPVLWGLLAQMMAKPTLGGLGGDSCLFPRRAQGISLKLPNYPSQNHQPSLILHKVDQNPQEDSAFAWRGRL